MVRITNKLLKKGRVAMYVMRDRDGWLESESPVETKYRKMD